MDWLRGAEHLRAHREPGVLITVQEVRGHAPRAAGATMVVSAADVHGSIGGGNLEATAVQQARGMLASRATEPGQLRLALNPHAAGEHGAQCCGGEVTVSLAPLPVPPAVAVFGVGHIGTELARILARHDLDLILVDSRPERVTADALAPLADAVARISARHSPDPGAGVGDLPRGTHVLVLTHDHAEDLAICDAALRRDDLGTLGLIGSTAKWRQFEARLADLGHPPEAQARIRTPIGLPGIPGKEPATIAVSVAAELLAVITAEAPAPTA